MMKKVEVIDYLIRERLFLVAHNTWRDVRQTLKDRKEHGTHCMLPDGSIKEMDDRSALLALRVCVERSSW